MSTRKDSSKLGLLLVDKGWISQTQLEYALKYQKDSDLRLGAVLVSLEMITPRQLKKVLRRQCWLRSVVASIVMAAVPVCPVLANEKTTDIKYTDNGNFDWEVDGVDNSAQIPLVNGQFKSNENFTLGLRHQFSLGAGLELRVSGASINFADSKTSLLSPQISLFSSGNYKRQHANNLYQSQTKHRSDRYKNTIPAIYRLTLKGYSLYERSDRKSEAWGLNRVKDKQFKDYELMFSVTKNF